MYLSLKSLCTAISAAALIITATAMSAHAWTKYSIEAGDLESFAKDCRAELSVEQMRSEVPSMLARLTVPDDVIEKLTSQTQLLGQVADYLTKVKAAPQFNIVLDGLPLAAVNRQSLYAVAVLTGLESVAGSRIDVKKTDFQGHEWLMTKRFCFSEKCRGLGRQREPDLTAFNSTPVCSDALCASEKLFGAERGTRILWAYLKYGAVLGRFTDANADANELSVDTIRALLIAFRSVPDHLRAIALRDAHFFHFRKGDTLPSYRGRKVFANGVGAVFDPMDEKSLYQQAAMFVHEIAHRTTLQNSIDSSDEWLHVSGWRMDLKTATPFPVKIWLSEYAKTNPLEDFAETFALYRIRPALLQKRSPGRYEFMKSRVFGSVEYLKDGCDGLRTN